jgi:hypothetical protein
MATQNAVKTVVSNDNLSAIRDRFGAINHHHVPESIKSLVSQLEKELGWTLGIESTNKRGGYECHSVDVYGYDTSRTLAVLQLRRAYRKKDGYWPEVSKVYTLAGIDDGQLFSHPLVSSPRRNRALDTLTPADTVRWAESKIFGVAVDKLNQIVRQGDIAIVPVKSIPSYARDNPVAVSNLVLRGSHHVQVDGSLFEFDGSYYLEGMAEIVHTKAQHKAVAVGEGRWKIVQGARGKDAWWSDSELGD